MTDRQRRILLVAHAHREDAHVLAREVAARLEAAGIDVRALTEDSPDDAADGCELVVVLGGDGTILRGAEVARASGGVPVLGVNLGHVGFLAEAEREDLGATVDHIVRRDWAAEERLAIEVRVSADGRTIWSSWALNEASVEKASRERMLDLAIEIDGRPLSTWGCDGVVLATPTGSTAYAFSGGGPVVWPQVDAMLLVPISAYALFARPLVLAPTTHIAVEVVPSNEGVGVLWCDGRRSFALPNGARVEVVRSDIPVRLARLRPGAFTDRLVAKFDLSTVGWRGAPRPETRVGTGS